MIPQAYISEWREMVPWVTSAQIEQDLILSRALVEIFSNPELANNFAFRGGTALHKLFINPGARYSEDLDLVQIKEGPIGSTLDILRQTLDPWLGKPRWKQNMGRVTLVYRFDSELPPITPMRLKIEINTREHLSVFGFINKEFQVNSRWYTGVANITTYSLEELLSTKLRALYQRKKGRDLFDLNIASQLFPKLDAQKILESFHCYIEADQCKVSRTEFEENLAEKISDKAFQEDILLLVPDGKYSEFVSIAEIKYVQE